MLSLTLSRPVIALADRELVNPGRGVYGRQLVVLVVDHYEDGADSMAEFLRLYGFRVLIARTGGAALELAAVDPPDVGILDVRLPDLNGWEVARWLRVQPGGKRTLLVAITGSGSNADRRRSARAGIDLHLVKPAVPAILVGVLDRFRREFAIKTWN